MALLLNFIILSFGIALLVGAGDLLVRGAAQIAHRFGVPAFIVGLTIVAFGTSAPELVVSVQAVLNGVSELALGSVIGSNIANILLVLGMAAFIAPMPTNMSGVARNAFIAVIASVLLTVLLFVFRPALPAWCGLILLSGIMFYIVWLIRFAQLGRIDVVLDVEIEVPPHKWALAKQSCFVVLGVIGLAVGGQIIIGEAVEIAERLNVNEGIIGLTIIAIGTSLPELSTVIVAGLRGEKDVALGNILGSNVFNILSVLGFANLFGPVGIPEKFLQFDIWVMLACMFVVFILVLRRQAFGRKIGILFLLCYIGYIINNGGAMMSL